MAYDKVVDSAKLDSDLRSVADSIRAKAGTTDELDFPLGFKSAVEGISTGVPINNQNKTITQNGTYTADEGFTGLGTVIVNVAKEGQIDIEEQWKMVIEGDTSKPITMLPSGLTKIKDDAFNKCSNLALTSLPDGITSIGNSAFYYCSSLALTSLPNGLTKIPSNAFRACSNLALTSLPDGITSIGTYAFESCTKITDITLPDSITSISVRAFGDCDNLKTVTFKGKSISIYRDAFYGCNKLTTINVPWAEGEVSDAPWGATNAEIRYNYVGE